MAKNYMNLSIKLAKAIFTTSDKGAYQVYNTFKGSREQYREIALREYIYAKYYTARMLLDAYAEHNPESRSAISEAWLETRELLHSFFSNDIYYGCTIAEADKRLKHYSYYLSKSSGVITPACVMLDLVKEGTFIMDFVLVDTIDSALKEAQQYLMSEMVGKSRNKSNGGCLTTLACFVLITTIFIMCL